MNSLSDVNALRVMIFIRYLVCCNEILRNDVSVSRGDVKFVNVPNRKTLKYIILNRQEN